MLIVGYIDDKLTHYDLTYRIGEGKLKTNIPVKEVLVQATGQELELIRSQFTNLPMHKGFTVVWKNEAAMFIIDNIIL